MAEIEGYGELDDVTRRFYQHALRIMSEAKIPFLLGGAYALAEYTGISRHTKDLDLFILPSDAERTLEAFRGAGYATEHTDPIWLAKAFSPEGAFVDFIYRSGNSVSEVDEAWFQHATPGRVLDVPVQLCPPEETIWTKAFIMERHRYDGADVAHYILAWAPHMDWDRLVSRFGPNWRVLLSHLVLFGFIYPDKASVIPQRILDELYDRARQERHEPAREKTCRGTLLSRVFYLVDVGPWGFRDARFEPRGSVTGEELKNWKQLLEAEAPDMLKAAGISLDETRVPPELRSAS